MQPHTLLYRTTPSIVIHSVRGFIEANALSADESTKVTVDVVLFGSKIIGDVHVSVVINVRHNRDLSLCPDFGRPISFAGLLVKSKW